MRRESPLLRWERGVSRDGVVDVMVGMIDLIDYLCSSIIIIL